jgi:putative inorganic carbon (hco3(-)) transporter
MTEIPSARVFATQPLTLQGPPVHRDRLAAVSAGKRAARSRTELLVADLYLLLLPVQISLSDTFRLAPSDFVLLFLYVLLIAHRTRFSRTGINVWHIGLALALLSGTFVTLANAGELTSYVLVNKDLGLLVLIATYFAFFTLARSWDVVEHVLRMFVISCTVHSALALAVFFTTKKLTIGPVIVNESTARLSGLLVDPNALGGLLGAALIVQLAGTRRDGFRIRGVLGIACSMILAVGLLMTYSRSAWLGTLIAVAVATLARPGRLLVTAALAAFGIALPLLLNGSAYLRTISDMASRRAQFDARITIISDALDMFWQNPLFGGGLGAFYAKHNAIVHNSVLWCLAELGVLGLAAICGLVAWVLMRGLAARQMAGKRRKRLIACLLLCHLLMFGLALGIEALYQRHWWVFMALIAASSGLARQDKLRDAAWRRPVLLRGN